MEQLLTENELAEMFKISTRSLRKARQNGSLPHVRLGRLVRYRVEDVQAFVAGAVVANDWKPTNRSTACPSGGGGIIGFVERQEQS